MRKFSGVAIVLIILGITVMLVLSIPGIRGGKKAVAADTSTVPAGTREEWLGVFLQGQRAGYSFSKVARDDQGITLESMTQITLNMMNTVRTLTTHAFVHTEADYTLKDFIVEITTTGHPTKIEGSLNGKILTLTSFSQGVPQTQNITLKEKPFFPDAMEEVIKNKKLKPGEELKIPYFDPTTQSSATATIKAFARGRTTVLGKEVEGTKYEIEFMGMISELWFDDGFRLIKNYSPNLGLEMLPMTKEEALADVQPANAFDLLTFFAVKLTDPIPAGQDLSSIKLELKGITTENLDLTDDFQKVTVREPLTIELTFPLLEGPDLKIPMREPEDFLQPSIYIQCDNPDIIRAARDIIGDAKGARTSVIRLTEGVFKMLRKNPTASLPSALDVLKTKEGDCNEHAILFAALARSVGIPTKIYVGLINLYGDAYWYHAWCAVWLGKWVPVDPTFNQFPADLYHLKLKEGEISEQAKVLQVVGKLKILILEYK
jgi:hypothetical protein